MNDSNMASHVTPAEWRTAMGRFASGVTVVTGWDGAAPIGTTINAFCSVSLDPPLLLVCMDLKNPALEPLERSGLLGINILGADGGSVAQRFGRKGDDDRFAGLDWRVREGGAPQLAAACVFIDCALEQVHMAGDHKLFVARGLAVDHASSCRPLLYHKGAFPDPADPATWE